MCRVLWNDDGKNVRVSDPDYPTVYDRVFTDKSKAIEYLLNMVER